MTEVYIDGVKLKTDDQTGRIAVTYQNFNFLSIGSIKAAITNRLSFPDIPHNQAILEQAAPLQAISSKSRENLGIRAVQDGIETIPSGVAQITGISERIEIDVQSGIKGFWDSLEGLYLNDIDLSTWNGLWDNDRHDTVRNTTSGLVCPVVNTGQLVDGTTYVDGYTYGSAMIPFFYYHTIMSQIAALVGKTFAGDIFADTNRYLKLAMSTRLVYNAEWLLKKRFKATKQSFFIDSADAFVTIDAFDQVLYNEDGFFSLGSGLYNIANIDTASKYFKGKFIFRTKADNTLTYIQIRKNGATDITSSFTQDGDTYIAESTSQEFLDSDSFSIVATNFLLGDINLSNISFELVPENTINTDRVQATDWYWHFDQLLPRISLKDFIKDFMTMFALVATEKNNVVTFKSWEEILTSIAPTTIELSKQNKDKKLDINYALSTWAQENNFFWVVQSDEAIITEDYGKGIITIVNDTIPASRDVYTSIFTASDQVTETRINQAAQITIYDQTGPAFTKAADFGSRLILLRDDDGVNFRFKSGTSRTDYFIAYFIDKNQTYSLDFQELIDAYYPTYQKVLNNYADVTGEFYLSAVDAVAMDLTTPFIKDGVMYVAEKVGPVFGDGFTKFKLIRLLIN